MPSFRSEFDPEIGAAIVQLDQGTLNKVLGTIRLLSRHGGIRQEVADTTGLKLATLDWEYRPKAELVTVEVTDNAGKAVVLVYMVEFENLKEGVVYFIALGDADKVTLEFIRNEGYTRYQRLKRSTS